MCSDSSLARHVSRCASVGFDFHKINRSPFFEPVLFSLVEQVLNIHHKSNC